MARASTPRKASPRRPAGELIVSLDELASILGVTPETMRSHLKQAPANADWLIERGRRGVGYKIAAAGAVAWWRSRSGGDSEDDSRRAALAEWRLTSLGDAGDDEGFGLTGKQRSDEYAAAIRELEFRKLIGQLCLVGDVEDETANAVIELRRELQGIGSTVRRRFGFEREVETAIDDAIADKLKAFVEKLGVDVDVSGG